MKTTRNEKSVANVARVKALFLFSIYFWSIKRCLFCFILFLPKEGVGC